MSRSATQKNLHESTLNHLLQLAKDGADVLRNPSQSKELVDSWLRYSEKVVELATKEYDPNIYLGYLRILLAIQQKNFSPAQKVKTCVDYILEVLSMLS